jgi:hypothetical protein
MTDEVSHTITLRIPDAYWPDAQKLLRMLRELHRGDGGTSKLVRDSSSDRRNGRRYTLTVKGTPIAVSETSRRAQQVQQHVDRKRDDMASSMMDCIKAAQAKRECEVADFLAQAWAGPRQKRT